MSTTPRTPATPSMEAVTEAMHDLYGRGNSTADWAVEDAATLLAFLERRGFCVVPSEAIASERERGVVQSPETLALAAFLERHKDDDPDMFGPDYNILLNEIRALTPVDESRDPA